MTLYAPADEQMSTMTHRDDLRRVHTRNPLSRIAPKSLRLLLMMCIDSETIRDCLSMLEGRVINHRKRHTQCQVLAELIQEHIGIARRIHNVLRNKLCWPMRRFRDATLYELTEMWSQRGEDMTSQTLAALLWTVADREAFVFRSFEDTIVEEITYRNVEMI